MAAVKTTPAERKALADEKRTAQAILRLRKAGTPWSAAPMRAIVKSAPKGRALLRKHGLAETGKGIAGSYERTPSFRAAESERRTKAPVKVTPRKRTAKRTRKAA